MKLLIIGNAGCGKTFLAKKIAKQLRIPVFHIDDIWFKPGGYGPEFERTAQERKQIIKNILGKKNYIIEGASGITAKDFAKHVSHLVMVAYDKNVCIESIKTRKLPKGQTSTPKQTAFLVAMAKKYYDPKNDGSISLNTHLDIFDDFCGSKYYITDRDDANRFRI
jgi:adenylate kinase family enzyme